MRPTIHQEQLVITQNLEPIFAMSLRYILTVRSSEWSRLRSIPDIHLIHATPLVQGMTSLPMISERSQGWPGSFDWERCHGGINPPGGKGLYRTPEAGSMGSGGVDVGNAGWGTCSTSSVDSTVFSSRSSGMEAREALPPRP